MERRLWAFDPMQVSQASNADNSLKSYLGAARTRRSATALSRFRAAVCRWTCLLANVSTTARRLIDLGATQRYTLCRRCASVRSPPSRPLPSNRSIWSKPSK